MKITRKQLSRIIKEEMNMSNRDQTISEQSRSTSGTTTPSDGTSVSNEDLLVEMNGNHKLLLELMSKLKSIEAFLQDRA